MNQDHSIHSRAEILGFDRCGIARCRSKSVADCWSDGSHRDGTAA